jgi:two-component system, cell cycle sensor histidine kinase and response regulator CckA
MTIESERKGVAQTVTPLSTSEPGVTVAVPAPAPPVLTPRRVLFMDDEPNLCTLVSRLLQMRGFQVDTACNGEETIALFEHALQSGMPYETVILDLTVSDGLGGVAALPFLRALHPTVKVVVSSGWVDHPVMVDPEEYGFQAVLPKPFSASKLFQLMTELSHPLS